MKRLLLISLELLPLTNMSCNGQANQIPALTVSKNEDVDVYK